MDKDSTDGSRMIVDDCAMIAAWAGEKDLGTCSNSELGLRAPDASIALSYGAVKAAALLGLLSRGRPRFGGTIVASLAPKNDVRAFARNRVEWRRVLEDKKEIELEIAYVLFVDIVGYSKLLIIERRLLELLNEIVRGPSNSVKRKQPSADHDSDRRRNGAGVSQHTGSAGRMRLESVARPGNIPSSSYAWACTAARSAGSWM